LGRQRQDAHQHHQAEQSRRLVPLSAGAGKTHETSSTAITGKARQSCRLTPSLWAVARIYMLAIQGVGTSWHSALPHAPRIQIRTNAEWTLGCRQKITNPAADVLACVPRSCMQHGGAKPVLLTKHPCRIGWR